MRINYCICEECGAHLDFGERCDCQSKKEAAPLQRERPHAKKTYFKFISKLPESQENIWNGGQKCSKTIPK